MKVLGCLLQTDMFQRSLSFLESLVTYVEAYYCLQRSRKFSMDRIYTMYEELLRMPL